MKPSEEIRETKNILFEEGWRTGSPKPGEDGQCLLSALRKAQTGMDTREVTGETAEERVAHPAFYMNADGTLATLYIRMAIAAEQRELGEFVYVPVLWNWNDFHAHTFDRVIVVLDRAEKIAEQRENVAEVNAEQAEANAEI